MNTPPLSVERSFKKGDTVALSGVPRIVMAKLQGDGTNPVSYSVCNASDLKDPRFGISLHEAELIAPETLTEEIKTRIRNFL